MKDIDRQDQQDVSGGYQPNDGGCFPTPIDYPYFPLVPEPVLPTEPLPGYTPIA
jgi:hypothetical protein